MGYLVTFLWGWLLGALLLGLGMGWIAAVHHGRPVSKTVARWLAVLVALLLGGFGIYVAESGFFSPSAQSGPSYPRAL